MGHAHCSECNAVIEEYETYCDLHRPEPEPSTPTRKYEPCCSFCGKAQRDVQRLIAGPTVYICNECVELCNEMCKEKKVTRRGKKS